MHFETKDNDIIMFPECDMDLYHIGVLHNQYGGNICHCSETHKLTEYNLSAHMILDFLILHSNDK